MACSAREPFRSIGRLHMVWGGGNGPDPFPVTQAPDTKPGNSNLLRKIRALATPAYYLDRAGTTFSTAPGRVLSHMADLRDLQSYTGPGSLKRPCRSSTQSSGQNPGSDPGERIRLTRAWTGHGVSTNLTFQTPKPEQGATGRQAPGATSPHNIPLWV
ncbi:hypothetical protein BO79DRAFT_224691 [Aspergillus costaricaensis CBS 115574]|uniref:Uncharacterized protein n=1 Tax=Aspergillus costaricaensis CBS 115574 TaxID=1448317 RepID=A0ACD1ITV2_9EURO|nr:hypothetical protein BO79DRAFT_224691 [Aspergillus costaricaensis CBS 115574]RAK93180.1 hypothetical protein BO79DRAFT_224691 [Aspergillus costaricaensis CBS 115574]